jgi:2-polyprenyl-3-methyl-5-hydroxy-6-metoxy-1,4-benzoquinol methylase
LNLKKVIKAVLKRPPVARNIVFWSLRLHNLSYRLVGNFSQYMEKDGLHPKHRLMQYHQWFMNHLQSNWHVLDIGCGNGALSYDLKEHCAAVVGIDINNENIKQANSQYGREGVTYLCADATRYVFKGHFDAIILSNVLEHIKERISFLKAITKYLKPNNESSILLRVPLYTRDWITLYKKELGIEWRLDKTHFIEYTFEQIEEEMRLAGLHIEYFEIKFGEFYGVIKKK